jgi:hypothetical protein
MSETQNNKRSDMPKKVDIAKHWIPKLVINRHELDYYYDCVFDEQLQDYNNAKTTSDNCDMCFACNVRSTVERCHIIPIWKDGNNDKENLHLLCRVCHIESEYLIGEQYNFWFENKDTSNSAIFQHQLRMTILYANEFIKGNSNVIPKRIMELFIKSGLRTMGNTVGGLNYKRHNKG